MPCEEEEPEVEVEIEPTPDVVRIEEEIEKITEIIEEKEEVPEPEPVVVEEPVPAPVAEKPVVEVYETAVPEMPVGRTALEDILFDAAGKVVILDFQYDACNPCQEIAPAFEALMEANPDAIFKKVDIFKHRDLLEELEITQTPTFKVWVNGEMHDTIKGIDLDPLNDSIEMAYTKYADH